MKKTINKNHKKQIIKYYLHKYRFHYIIGILTLVFVDIIQLRIPLITKDVTDGLQTGTYTMENIANRVTVLIVIGISIAIGRFVWRYFIFGTSRHIEYELRNDFFGHLEKLSLRYYNDHQTGDLMAHATNDLNAVRMMLGPGILMALDAFVLTTLVIIQMVTVISLRLTLFAIIPLPFIAIGSLLLGKVVQLRFKEKQEAFSELTDQVQENLSGIRVIKAFVQESKELLAFQKVNAKNFEKNMKLVKLFAWMMPLSGLISGLSISIILGYGGYLVILGDITIGEFVAYINYLYMLIWPMIAFGMCINIISQGRASFNRIQSILNEVPEIEDNEKTKDIKVIKGNITIKNLNFTYSHSKEKALKNININIIGGQTIGIVGRTGSGKTTLVNLLLRLINPRENTIFMDGNDIFEIPLKTLRYNIGYVPQDNYLFSNTIKNNIAFGMPLAYNEEVKNAAQIANVHDNIMDFTNEYETIVGEKGVTLSGGQKQRVSIARAIIKNTPILILDDAVSAVDTNTEEQILRHLKEKRKNKTTIIIAHRISTIQHADNIFVLDEGEIVEEGTHTELIAKKGLYYNMVKRQQLEKELEKEV